MSIVTKHKKYITENEELFSDNDFKKIFDFTIEGVVKVNAESKFLLVNKGICDMLGFTKRELINKTVYNITFKEDLEKTNSVLESLKIKSAKKYKLSKRLVHKNGTVINCEISVIPFYDSENKLDYSIAFIYNKDEKIFSKKQYADLKSSIDNVACVILTDATGNIIEVNNPTIENSGYSRKELIGKNMSIFNSNFHSKDFFTSMWKTIGNGEIWQGEIRNKVKNGKYCWFFETITPIFESDGKIKQYMTVLFDITEAKLSDKILTRKIIDIQEQERERFAMEIHDGLGQILLAAKMNLSAVNYSGNNLDDDSKKAMISALNLMREATREARNISHNLMGKTLNQNGIIYSLNIIINSINRSQKKIKFSLKQKIGKTRFDREIEMGVYRSLQEQVKNIIKHSKATAAKVEIKKVKNNLIIITEDNGIGIDLKEIKNKKGIGFQNMNSRIEYLGGKLQVESKIKKGSKIVISIPI